MTTKRCFGIIYKATNKVSGKSYIGQTIKTLKQRKREHLNEARRGDKDFYFYRAIRKYGTENFVWLKLCECKSKNELDRMEKYYIVYYDSFENGYNLTLGGEGTVGWCPSIEVRQKISIAKKGKMIGRKNPFYGKKHSKETRQKMKENHADYSGRNHPMFGRTLLTETKRKIGIASKGRNIGRKHTEEAKEKIRRSNSCKWLIIYPNNTIEIIKNLNNFCNKNKLNVSAMSMVSSGKYNYEQHKGFKCKKLYELEVRKVV